MGENNNGSPFLLVAALAGQSVISAWGFITGFYDQVSGAAAERAAAEAERAAAERAAALEARRLELNICRRILFIFKYFDPNCEITPFDEQNGLIPEESGWGPENQRAREVIHNLLYRAALYAGTVAVCEIATSLSEACKSKRLGDDDDDQNEEEDPYDVGLGFFI